MGLSHLTGKQSLLLLDIFTAQNMLLFYCKMSNNCTCQEHSAVLLASNKSSKSQKIDKASQLSYYQFGVFRYINSRWDVCLNY